MAAERSAEWHRLKSTCRTPLPESVCGLHRHTSKASVSCTPRQLGLQPHALPSSVLYELASKLPYSSLCGVCIQVDQPRWHFSYQPSSLSSHAHPCLVPRVVHAATPAEAFLSTNKACGRHGRPESIAQDHGAANETTMSFVQDQSLCQLSSTYILGGAELASP